VNDCAGHWTTSDVADATVAIARRPARSLDADVVMLILSLDLSGTGVRERARGAIAKALEDIHRNGRALK
jgi:hypothetical protein